MDDSVPELIGNALRYTNIVNSDAEIPSVIIQRGVAALNDIITMWGADGNYIPYQSVLTLPLVVGQEAYTIGLGGGYDFTSSPIESILTLVINLDNSPGVDYQCLPLTESYYANITYKLAQGIPSNYLFRDYIDYAEILFQPLPGPSASQARIVCKQRLMEVAYSDDLTMLPSAAKMALKMELIALAGPIWGKEASESQRTRAIQAVKSYHAANVKSLDLTVKRDESVNLRGYGSFNFWVDT